MLVPNSCIAFSDECAGSRPVGGVVPDAALPPDPHPAHHTTANIRKHRVPNDAAFLKLAVPYSKRDAANAFAKNIEIEPYLNCYQWRTTDDKASLTGRQRRKWDSNHGITIWNSQVHLTIIGVYSYCPYRARRGTRHNRPSRR